MFTVTIQAAHIHPTVTKWEDRQDAITVYKMQRDNTLTAAYKITLKDPNGKVLGSEFGKAEV